MGGRAHATDRGETLQALPDVPPEPVTLLITHVHCSTPIVFQALTESKRGPRTAYGPAHFNNHLLTGNQQPLHNRLQDAALRCFPDLAPAAIWANTHQGMLCGSGGTWFAPGHIKDRSSLPDHWELKHCWTQTEISEISPTPK